MLFTSYAVDRYQTIVCTAKPLPAFERIPRTKMHRFHREKSDINYFMLTCESGHARDVFPLAGEILYDIRRLLSALYVER